MKIPPFLLEVLAVHEFFRTLGYPAADIYLNLVGTRLGVLVKEGEKRAEVVIGEGCPSLEELRPLWEEAVQWWNVEATEAERRVVFESSNCMQDAVQIRKHMLLLGLHPGEFN